MNTDSDDTLTVYAQSKRAVLVTHDKEFSARRRRNPAGWHLHMKCQESEAADMLVAHLPILEPLFAARPDLFVSISKNGLGIPTSAWT